MRIEVDSTLAAASVAEARRLIAEMERTGASLDWMGQVYGVQESAGVAAAHVRTTAAALDLLAVVIERCADAASAADLLSALHLGWLPADGASGSESFAVDATDPSDQGVSGAPHFVLGQPARPTIEWDEDFVYDSASPGWRDYLAREKWQIKLAGAQLVRSDLDDALAMYAHYWDNSGDPIVFDYEEAVREDEGIAATVDSELRRAQRAAEGFVAEGNTVFSMTGDASASAHYPTTENWQKAIGGHQVWSSADVRVAGTTIEMTVVVHAEDYYNFNRGQHDIATSASDDENGRFTELGWARPFPSSGAATRTLTWQLGELDFTEVSTGTPQRNPGREDNEIERDSGDPDRASVPTNNRATGGAR